MKFKLMLATLFLATSAFGAGFVRIGVGVGPGIGPGFGYRGGFYGGVAVAAPGVGPYYPPTYYAPSVLAFGYVGTAYVRAPNPAYGYGPGYGWVRPGYRYAPGFVGPRYYGGRVYGGGRVVGRR